MSHFRKYAMLAGGLVIAFFAQQPPHINSPKATLHEQSASTISLTKTGDGQALEITNTAFEVTSEPVPGRPPGERLLLRKTTSSKCMLGDVGQDATTLFEAWPLGVDANQKPLYTVKFSGTGGEAVDGALIVASRGLEEVDWWSVYRLGTGQHLFDTYVPVVRFSISAAKVVPRYIGLEVPPDDVADARLRRPDVVAVITYASEERVEREALLTCDNSRQASELRSYSDTTRKVSVADEVPPRAVRIAFRANDPSAPAASNVNIPLSNDDLDIAHAQLPEHLHLAFWKR